MIYKERVRDIKHRDIQGKGKGIKHHDIQGKGKGIKHHEIHKGRIYKGRARVSSIMKYI